MTCADEQLDAQVWATVVLVNYNGGDAVLGCLESVFAHIQPNVEVLVVDNASDDGSPDSIKARFPAVQVIEAGANLGFGAGNNLGIRHAGGEYIAFLNPDTVVSEGWLDALVRELKRGGGLGQAGPEAAQAGSLRYMESPQRQHQTNGLGSDEKRASTLEKNDFVQQPVALVTSKILMADDPDTINTCGNNVHLTGITLCRGLGAPREAFDRMDDVGAISGAAFAMRKEIFEELGGFDEDMFLYMEDTDLSLRARLAGYRCRHVPDSIVMHRYALKITPMKVFYQERNRYLMLLKDLRWPTLIALLPALICAELIAWAFVLLKDRPNARNKVLAYRWTWSNFQSILGKRKLAQSLRRAPDRAILRGMTIRLDFGQGASPVVAFLAHLLFDPVFAALKLLALAVVWW